MRNVIFAVAFLLILMVVILTGKSNLFHSKPLLKKVSGQVSTIYEDGSKNTLLKLKDQKLIFYIQASSDNHLNIDLLLNKLNGKEINISFHDSWNPLGSIGDRKMISELTFNDELVYSEPSQ